MQCKKESKFPLTIEATASGKTAVRDFKLQVAADVPPVIVTSKLPEAVATQFYTVGLEGKGGVGRLTWKVSDGHLPYGLRMEEYGVLLGCPGEAGDFSEPFWVFDHKLEKTASGKGVHHADFGILWEDSSKGINGRGLWIGLKIPKVPGAKPWKAVDFY